MFGGGERGFTDTRVIELSKYMYAVVDTCIEYDIVLILMNYIICKNNKWNLTFCFVCQQNYLIEQNNSLNITVDEEELYQS